MNKTNTTIRGIFANRAFFTRIVRIDLVQKIRKLLCLDSRQQQKKRFVVENDTQHLFVNATTDPDVVCLGGGN